MVLSQVQSVRFQVRFLLIIINTLTTEPGNKNTRQREIEMPNKKCDDEKPKSVVSLIFTVVQNGPKVCPRI